jgi:surface antigen
LLHKVLALGVLLIFSFAASDAVSKPPWARDDGGPGAEKGKGKWKQKGPKKHKHRGGKGARFSAGPPPWAPAHGYRRKFRGSRLYADNGHYHTPYSIDLGTCNRDKIGMVIGGVAGGALGSRVGKGDDRLAATILGTVAGAVIGGYIGRNLDKTDETCMGQALEHAATGSPVRWTNSDTGTRYEITPKRTYQRSDGRYCREYTAGAQIGGAAETVTGIACRRSDGTWEIRS